MSQKIFGREFSPYEIAAALIIFVAVVLRFYNLGGTSLWYDESVYIINSQTTFAGVLENTKHANSSPLFLPILLWMMDSIVGLNPFLARIPSALAGILSVGVLLALPRVGVAKPVALIAAALLAIAQIQVLYAQEVREYGLSILVSALVLYGFLAAHNKSNCKLLLIMAIVTPWITYGGCFAVLAACVSLFFMKLIKTSNIRWPALAAVFAGFVVSVMLAYIFVAQYQLYTGKVGYFAEHYLSQSGLNPVLWLIMNAAGVFLATLPGLLSVILLPLVLVVFAARFVRNPLDIFDHPAVIILAVLLGGIVMAGILEFYPFGSPRHSVFIGPILCLAIAYAVYEVILNLPESLRKSASVGLAAVVGLSAILGLHAVPIAKGVHPALDKATSVSIYGEYEDNIGLLAWAREKQAEGYVLFGSHPARPALKFYGADLSMLTPEKRALEDLSLLSDLILEKAGDAPIALAYSGAFPEKLETVLPVLEADGYTTKIDFTGPRVAGILLQKSTGEPTK